MAKIVIGGQSYEVPPLKFKSVKRAWPFMQEAAEANHNKEPFRAVDAVIAVVSEGLSKTDTPLTIEFIDENLDAIEIEAFVTALGEIMEEAGLVTVDKHGNVIAKDPESGEAKGEAAPPSTATATDMLQSSSPPDVPAEIGT